MHTGPDRIVVVQPNYKLIAKRPYLSLNEAVMCITAYALKDKCYASDKERDAEIRCYSNEISDLIYRSMPELSVNLMFNYEYDADQDKDLNTLDFIESTMPLTVFVGWAQKVRLSLPSEFEEALITDKNDNLAESKCVNSEHFASQNRSYKVGNVIISVSENEVPVVTPLEAEHKYNSRYRFEKVGKTWDIQFGDILIRGINKLEGMDYIKVMLQFPYREFGVTELRSLFNPDSISDKVNRIDVDGCFHEEAEPVVQKHSASKQDNLVNKTLLPYKQQLKDLHADREEAERNGNDAEIDRINKVVSMIEEEINNVLRNKNDDPELDKNRRSVWKNINKALETIQTEELANGCGDTLLVYEHLNKYIQTGKTCMYNPPLEDKPEWSF